MKRVSPVRILPELTERAETGPLQFRNDWPGVFFRGDNALHYSLVLRQLLDTYKSIPPIERATIESLQKDLASCKVDFPIT